MRLILSLFALTLAALPLRAEECAFPVRAPVKGKEHVIHTNECGQRYQPGYRLTGNTLHMPRGGTHTLPEASEAEAEKVLRETYGLVGERDALVRTKW